MSWEGPCFSYLDVTTSISSPPRLRPPRHCLSHKETNPPVIVWRIQLDPGLTIKPIFYPRAKNILLFQGHGIDPSLWIMNDINCFLEFFFYWEKWKRSIWHKVFWCPWLQPCFFSDRLWLMENTYTAEKRMLPLVQEFSARPKTFFIIGQSQPVVTEAAAPE